MKTVLLLQNELKKLKKYSDMKPTCFEKRKHIGTIIKDMCGLLSVSPSGFIIP